MTTITNSKDCANIKGILSRFTENSVNVPSNKAAGYSYTKRSLEHMADGMEGTVAFDASGNVVGAAAYYTHGSSLWVETLGSIGSFDGKTTPGLGIMYNIFKEAQKYSTVRLHSLPGKSALFYERLRFKGSAKDALDMTINSKDAIPFMKWYEDTVGITGVSEDSTKLGSISEIAELKARIALLDKKNSTLKTASIRAKNNAEKRELRKQIKALEA